MSINILTRVLLALGLIFMGLSAIYANRRAALLERRIRELERELEHAQEAAIEIAKLRSENRLMANWIKWRTAKPLSLDDLREELEGFAVSEGLSPDEVKFD